MKRKFTRVAAVLCGMSLLLTGCRIGNKNIVVSNILNDRQVFKIEGTVCSLKEARVYLTNYQNIYGRHMVWISGNMISGMIHW